MNIAAAISVFIALITSLPILAARADPAPACCTYLDQAAPVPPGLRDTVRELVTAIHAKDEAVIFHLAHGSDQAPESVSGGARIDPATRNHLFDGAKLRQFNPRIRSAAEILARDEPRVLLAWQDEAHVFVNIHPATVTEASQNPDFWSDRWMIDFFTCEFSAETGQWRLGPNACFADTCGPYPLPFG
jgi:hypothetical protein